MKMDHGYHLKSQLYIQDLAGAYKAHCWIALFARASRYTKLTTHSTYAKCTECWETRYGDPQERVLNWSGLYIT